MFTLLYNKIMLNAIIGISNSEKGGVMAPAGGAALLVSQSL